MSHRCAARRRIWLAAVVALASAACSGAEISSDANILKVIIRASPTSFDPRVGTDEQSTTRPPGSSTAS